MKRRLAALLLALPAACGGGDRELTQSVPDGVDPREADISILVMGNSHASLNNIQGMIAAIVHAARPDDTVAIVEAPGWMFLEDRVSHAPSMQLLRSQDWSFVILQAQKYSTTGCCTYSTEEAKQLVRESRTQNALPVLFPEWPREGVDETQRIYDLHVSIAQAEPACVAPIGQAFDLAHSRYPDLRLHADDGNHSNPPGAYLAALVIASTLTGASPLDAPTLPPQEFSVEQSVQELLKGIADETVRSFPPRQYCPDDPY